jgi:hypothetical protein
LKPREKRSDPAQAVAAFANASATKWKISFAQGDDIRGELKVN